MNIEQNYNYRPAFQALSLRKKGFDNCPELAESIIAKFLENKNVDEFIKKYDVDVTIQKKKNSYKFIMEMLNPKREGKLTDLFKRKKIKSEYTGTDIHHSSIGKDLYVDGRYFNENSLSHYEEYGSPYGYGKDGVRPKVWLNVENINEDIENLKNGKKVNKRKLAKENEKALEIIRRFADDDTPYWNLFGHI